MPKRYVGTIEDGGRLKLHDKVAVITSGNSGVGLELTLEVIKHSAGHAQIGLIQ